MQNPGVQLLLFCNSYAAYKTYHERMKQRNNVVIYEHSTPRMSQDCDGVLAETFINNGKNAMEIVKKLHSGM